MDLFTRISKQKTPLRDRQPLHRLADEQLPVRRHRIAPQVDRKLRRRAGTDQRISCGATRGFRRLPSSVHAARGIVRNTSSAPIGQGTIA